MYKESRCKHSEYLLLCRKGHRPSQHKKIKKKNQNRKKQKKQQTRALKDVPSHTINIYRTEMPRKFKGQQ